MIRFVSKKQAIRASLAFESSHKRSPLRQFIVMWNKKLVVLTGMLASTIAPGLAVIIDFERNSPEGFVETNPLREEYASLGVHFSGPTADGGGATVNDSSWGATAISGTDILGFNDGATLLNGGVPTGPERIDFDANQSAVSVFYSGSFTDGSIGRLEAYDSSDNLVASDSLAAAAGQWVWLLVNSTADIAYVLVDSDNDSSWMLDDLEFDNPVPEPATVAALALGFVATLRRKTK